MTDVQAIARAAVNNPRAPRRVAELRTALVPYAAESVHVLDVAASRLHDMADSGLAITPERTARIVEVARAYVAAGGRVCLAGWVAQ